MILDDQRFVREYCELQAELARHRDALATLPAGEYGWLRLAVEQEIDRLTAAIREMDARAKAEVQRRRAA